MDVLTSKQRRVLDFISDFIREHGVSPTLREIQTHFGFASSFAARRHVVALQKKGQLLPRTLRSARSLIPSQRPRTGIPLLGMIPAGFSIIQDEESGHSLDLNPATLGFRPSASVFALRVRGDSMVGAHIVDGDLAILEKRPAQDQDIVAALIDGEVTLKRLVKGPDGYFFLRAENPNYPELVPAQSLEVQGVLGAVIRPHQR